MELRILAGTATLRPDPRFYDCLPRFLYEASKRYDIDHKFVVGKTIIDASNELAEYAIQNNYSHLLFIEDDHYGFTAEMLEALLKSARPVTAIPYYSRHYPFIITAMDLRKADEKGKLVFEPMNYRSGYHEVDLVGMGFTLIEVDFLKKFSKPIFTYPLKGVGADHGFCRRMKSEFGVRPVACYDHMISHRGVKPENIQSIRRNHFLEHRAKRSYMMDRLKIKKPAPKTDIADLHVITPAHNRNLLIKNVLSLCESDWKCLNVIWHVVLDDREGWGSEKYNKVIDSIKSGWVWMLDNDNMVHPGMFERIAQVIEESKWCRGIIFSQRREPENLIAEEGNVRVGGIDLSQYVLRRDLIGEHRLKNESYCDDGNFIIELYEKNPDEFVFINEAFSLYNAALA